jgi:hypothetical protein
LVALPQRQNPTHYQAQLRRLVYWLLFLFVIEDGNLLLPPDCKGAPRQRYFFENSLSHLLGHNLRQITDV